MRIFLLSLFSTISLLLTAQLQAGFDAVEAREMIQLCNSYTYLDLYGSDKEIIPEGYVKEYTSPSLGMDNVFQVYRHGTIGVINFRGSTTKKTSWLENLYASMIPVKGTIEVNERKFKYKVGKDTASAVHAGYMLAISFLEEEVRNQIKRLNKNGVFDIILTGHSQGGAIAQLMRAHLEEEPFYRVRNKNNFKVYAFANPMIGNRSFSNEYAHKFCDDGMSFVILNPDDFVPNMPINFKDGQSWEEQLITLLTDSDSFDGKEAAIGGFMSFFKGNIESMAKNLSERINKQLMKELGDISMPSYKQEINYVHTGNVILISPTEYPLELKDSSILNDKAALKKLKRNEDGTFENKSLYKKSSWMLQHKPYNYYTAILKEYFPEEYERLGQKYFVMPK